MPVLAIVNPAMLPAVFAVIVFAVMSPVILASDAVICQELLNINFEFDDDIAAEEMLKPAIVPAVFAVIVFAVISP